MLSHPVSAENNLTARSVFERASRKTLVEVKSQGFLEAVFAFVLAAFFKIAAKAPRVIGRIFFRVSSRGSKFFCLCFIDLLYHARRRLRIGRAEPSLDSIAFAANRQLLQSG